MGLLDDAIREHLELKRQHGASDEELTRQEAEAFGPARREVAPAAAAGLPDAPPETQEEAALLGEPPVPHEPPVFEPDADRRPFEPGVPADTAPHGDPLERLPPEPPLADEPIAAGPEAAELPPTAAQTPPSVPSEEDPGVEDEPPRAAGDTPPRGLPAVETPPGEPGEDVDEEDVLEETPDFLQDAPEHDRLWFEQKPPRDFDFD